MHKDTAKVLFTVLFFLLASIALISIIPFPIAYRLAESMEELTSYSDTTAIPWLYPTTEELTVRMLGMLISAASSLLAVLFVVMGRVKPFRITASISLIVLLALIYNIMWPSIILLDPIFGTITILYTITAIMFALNLTGKIKV